MSRPKADKNSVRAHFGGDPNPNSGPVFGDLVTGRSNGRRAFLMDSRGGRYRSALNGREKRGGSRTKGSK